MAQPNRPIKLSLRKKLAFAALTTMVFFGLMELLLALIGVQPQARLEDRTVGFSSYLPLFVSTTDEHGQAVMTTAENKWHWFNRQSFPKLKAANTKRIFCMGGSTTYGHPYWDETSFAGWLREYLPTVDQEHSWEVINAGGISYGSHRVAALMEELANYQPDLFIVYSAHNEFLERHTYAPMFERSGTMHHLTAWLSHTRVWSVTDRLVNSQRQPTSAQSSPSLLPAEVDEELNHTIGPANYHRDKAWHKSVVDHYAANLQKMIDTAHRCQAQILFILPAVNEKDCSPFKSEPSTNESKTDELNLLIENGKHLISQSQLQAATILLRRAVALDDGFALAHYWLGQSLLAEGKEAEALEEFQRAIDEDVCPLRAISSIKASLRSVAKKNRVPLLDFESQLRDFSRQHTGQAVLGAELFLDHVHPTIDGNRLLATWIVEDLQQRAWLRGTSINSAELQPRMDEIRTRVLEAIDRDDEIFALRNLAKVLHWSGKFEEAIPRARDVLDLSPGDPESRYLVASCLANLGRTEQALEEYDLLFADGVGYPKAYLAYGELLLTAGHYEAAKAYLLLAILRDPDSSAAYYSLAKTHRALGEDKFADEAQEKARSLNAARQ